MGTEAGLFLLVIIAAVGMLVYFAPCLVASRRNHRNAMPIFILNLFLGWTFVGWVGALVWAMTDNTTEAKNPATGGWPKNPTTGGFGSDLWVSKCLLTSRTMVLFGFPHPKICQIKPISSLF